MRDFTVSKSNTELAKSLRALEAQEDADNLAFQQDRTFQLYV